MSVGVRCPDIFWLQPRRHWLGPSRFPGQYGDCNAHKSAPSANSPANGITNRYAKADNSSGDRFTDY